MHGAVVRSASVAVCFAAGAALQLTMFTTNSVWLMFFLFWLFGMAMSSFACCVSVFLESSQSASNAGLAIVLVSDRLAAALSQQYPPELVSLQFKHLLGFSLDYVAT